MAEIHIPKDAESILDEIFKLAQQVEANDFSYDKPPNIVDEEWILKSKQDCNNLLTAIRHLGYRWCEMDPITYYSAPMSLLDEDWSLMFYVRGGTKLENPAVFTVPFEIFRIVAYANDFSPEQRDELANEVLGFISQLKEKIFIKARLADNSAEFEYSEGSSQKDKDTISKPRLINAGRTIECSKGPFDFTVQQAKVIKIMWKKGINSQEFYQEQDILEEAGIGGTSFANVFKSRRKEFNAVFEQHESMKDCWRLNLGQTDD